MLIWLSWHSYRHHIIMGFIILITHVKLQLYTCMLFRKETRKRNFAKIVGKVMTNASKSSSSIFLLWICIIASPGNRCSVIVDRRYVFKRFSWLFASCLCAITRFIVTLVRKIDYKACPTVSVQRWQWHKPESTSAYNNLRRLRHYINNKKS